MSKEAGKVFRSREGRAVIILVSLMLVLLAVGVFVPPLYLWYVIGDDFDIALPNGYLISRVHGWRFLISSENSSCVVDICVENYAVKDDVVTGFVSYECFDTPPHKLGPEGYFILDTKTGALQQGLTEDLWRAALPSHGFSTPPVLKEPCREDAIAAGK